MGIPPNRLVAVLTPLVFAPLAGAISAFAADNLPGIDVSSDQLQQVFIAGALIAFGKAGLWLKGWQDWENGKHAVPDDVANDIGLEATVIPGAGDDPADVDPALADADPDLEPDYDDDYDAQPYDDGFLAVGSD